jgi:flagellar protein FlbD
MIQLTRINHRLLVLNADLIEHVEVTPDTVITMTTGQKYVVLETPSEVVSKVIGYRQKICEGVAPCPSIRSTGLSRASLPTCNQPAAVPNE